MKKWSAILLTIVVLLFGSDAATLAGAAGDLPDVIEATETTLVELTDDEGADAPAGGARPTAAEVKHPDKAPCAVCAAKGSGHGEEKVTGRSQYLGAWYYFCSDDCKQEFDADPASFVVASLPRPAPDMRLRMGGEDRRLADFRGTVLLVDFWATWCKPCVKMMPKLQKLHDKHKLEAFSVVGVSIDEDPTKPVKFVVDKEIGYPVVVDDASSPAWRSFGVKAIPATFLIDREGRIVAQWTGNDVKWKEIESAVEGLLGTRKHTD